MRPIQKSQLIPYKSTCLTFAFSTRYSRAKDESRSF